MNKEQAKALLPIIQAFAEGKTIQYSGNGAGWVSCTEFEFGGDPAHYRIKPEHLTREELLKLCGGKEPHREDGWKEEWLQDGWRPLLKGENIHEGDEGTNSESPPRFVEHIAFRGPATLGWSRTRRPLPYKPKLVPLEASDVPPGSAVRIKGGHEYNWFSVVSVHRVNVKLGSYQGDLGTDVPTYEQLQQCEILRPGQSDWQPCSKEERS